jgi:3-oxoacyl-[acyl-carrier protein] reductase
MSGLQGRVALVTGGSRGIGRGIAVRLAQAGAAVAVAGVRADGTGREAVLQEITELGTRGLAVGFDVSDRAQVSRAVAEVEAALGAIDVLVTSAGVFDYGYTSALAISEDAWDQMYGVNLKGVYQCCVAVLPGMVTRRFGRIVNISSTAGITGGTSGIHYAATKGGVIALSLALAREFASHGVTVNVVAPSKIDTDMLQQATSPEKRMALMQQIPVGRLGTPADVADAVHYFCLDETSYVTGQVLTVSGGY